MMGSEDMVGPEGMVGSAGMGYGAAGGRPAPPTRPSSVDLSPELGLIGDVAAELFAARLRKGQFGSAFVTWLQQAPRPGGEGDAPATSGGMPGMAGGPGSAGMAAVSSATGEAMGMAPGAGYPMQAGNAGSGSEGAGYGMQPDGSGAYGSEMMAGSAGYGSAGYGAQGMAPGGGAYGSERMEPGSGGPGMPAGMPGMGNRRPGGPRPPAAASIPAPELPRWRPGLAFIGKLNATDAIAKAEEHSLDVLLHFEVVVRTSQTGAVKNVTRARVYEVASGDPVVVSKPIDNFEVFKLADADQKTERDSVAEVLETLFAVIDEKMTFRPMPTLDQEAAQRRVIQLIETGNQDRLRTMAEIRLYQWQQAIDLEEVATAFHMAAGDDALSILYGLPEESRKTLEELLEAGE
jgi:hypothetical protein